MLEFIETPSGRTFGKDELQSARELLQDYLEAQVGKDSFERHLTRDDVVDDIMNYTSGLIAQTVPGDASGALLVFARDEVVDILSDIESAEFVYQDDDSRDYEHADDTMIGIARDLGERLRRMRLPDSAEHGAYARPPHLEGCPHCGSSDIEGSSVDIDGPYARQDVSCSACGKRHTIEFVLARCFEAE